MRALLSFLLAVFSLSAFAQTNESISLELLSPVDYQVFQRQSPTNGSIIIDCVVKTKIRGALTNFNRVITRIEGPSIGLSRIANMTSPPFDNRVRRFRVEMQIPAGGWYRLQVQLIGGGTNKVEVTVEHVGVGEIFVVAGQSNSANHGEEKQRATNSLVVAFGDGHWQPAVDPEPGASGKGGSFMPAFGDAMAEKFQVPIAMVPIGEGGTSVREWLPAGDAMVAPPDTGARTISIVTNGFKSLISTGELFDRITAVEKQFGTNGFRAVLWHQGESDSHEPPDRQITPATYRQYLQHVIEVSRAEAGWRMPWFVAQVSYHSPQDTGWQELRDAQKSLVTDGIVLAGPNTDELGPEFRQNNGKGIHFNARGLKRHGEMWANLVGAWLDQQISDKPAAK